MKNSGGAGAMTRRIRNLSLLSIIIVTAGLWAGVAGIRLNSDDYQYLASLAPIKTFGDVLRPFVSPDANPSYFRPVTNMTTALDFFLFGWNGGAYHLTNLLFHLIATLLVFYFVRAMFGLTELESLWASLAFGISAAHETNLVWNAGREDTLAAIFLLFSLLLLKKSQERRSVAITIGAWLSFALALLSKESAVLAVPLVAFLFWERETDWKHGLLHSIKVTFQYTVLTVLFYFYHQHFAQSIAESQPLTAAGGHSILALSRNGLYAIGYFLLPLDLSSATLLFARYREILSFCTLATVVFAVWILWKSYRTNLMRELAPALLFSFITGAVLFLTFERWRLYLPSVGLIAVIAIFVRHTSSRLGRAALPIVLVTLGGFHVFRALEAESEWRAGSELLDGLKNNLTQVLSKIPKRPATIGFLDVPAKLGSASVLQLGKTALLQRAEADRISDFNRKTASIAGTEVDSWSAVDIYALDRDEGFRGLAVARIGPDNYLVSVPAASNIILYPAILTSNVIARRDRSMAIGDSMATPEFVDIVRSVESGMAKSIEVRVRDTAAALLSLNRANVFERIH